MDRLERVLALALLLVSGLVLLAALLRGRRPPRPAPGPGAADPCAKLRRELDEMVRRTNERNNYINSTFSSMEDGFVLVDAGDRVVLYNPRAQSLLGLGPRVFFDPRPGEPPCPAAVAEILEACRSVSRSRQGERLRLQSADGLVLDVAVSPIRNKYQSGADFGSLAIVKDVTAIERLENMKKDFVATVSHEFRTPLTLISGFMEMFKTAGHIEAADRDRALEIVEIETERLKRLVSELLTLSEIENSLPRFAQTEIDVADLVVKMGASLGELAERKGQRLETRISVEPGRLKGNESWFYQAVKNLAENAIKYTPPGGSILIEATSDAEAVSVAVSDTGIGIAAEEQERIFERFYRVDRSRGSGGGGNGLGLALVRDIASIFGGSVEVRSEPGKGSVFTMRLPAAPCA